MTKPTTKWPRGRWRVNRNHDGRWFVHAPDCGGWDDGGSCTDLGEGHVSEVFPLAECEIRKAASEVTA